MVKGDLLVIDDDEMFLSQIGLLLEDVADNIFLCTSGSKGLTILKEQKIHCIVCDINMPGLSGVDVLKEVRQQNLKIPFIFYTGNATRPLMTEALKYGAFDFIEKPNVDGLEEVVERALALGLHKEKKGLT